jgi:chemotaxis signal transduction protein
MAVLDFDLPLAEEATAVAPPVAAAPIGEAAQAVRCGERWFAFPYGWARSAVEQMHLSAVPGAPPWLAGAANVEGRIVPVIDLVAWASPGRFLDARAKDARLLVGGQGEDMAAVLFQGMPRLVRVSREPHAIGQDRLTPYVMGHDINDLQTVALDAPRLIEALIEELALR